MTEISRPWSGTVTGDAGKYSDDQWSDVWDTLFCADNTLQGVVFGKLNELEITGVASPVSVNTGYALVDGDWYKNDSAVSVAVPTPAGATRIDRIVLRKSWSAQTVRITRIEGVEGGGVPALTQTDGTTWDIPLYQASITTGAAITLTDEREALGSALYIFNNIVGFKEVYDNEDSGAAATIDWNNGNKQQIRLTGDCAFTFTDLDFPCGVTLYLLGDGSARAPTWDGDVTFVDDGEADSLGSTNNEVVGIFTADFAPDLTPEYTATLLAVGA